MSIGSILTKFRLILLCVSIIISISVLGFDYISGEGVDVRKSSSVNYILNSTLYPYQQIKIKSTSGYPKLQLIELIKDQDSKLSSQEAVVMMHGNYKQGNISLNLFLQLEKHSKLKRKTRFFSIEATPYNKKFKQSLQKIEKYLEGVHQFFEYLTDARAFKKITIIAVAFAADTFLNYLSRVSIEFYENIDKIIFINAKYKRFSPQNMNYYPQYYKMLQRFNETDRSQHINSIRIVSIQTEKVNRQLPHSYQKLILLSGRSLKSFLHINSRYMWSIYMLFDTESAFHFLPFLDILASFIKMDEKTKMSMKQIDYFFRFRQNPILEPVSSYKHEFALDCADVYGHNFVDSRYFLKKGCWIFKFLSNHNSGLIFQSRPQVELFTQKFIQIPPFISDNYKTLYYINNLSSLNGLILRNPTDQVVTVRFSRPMRLSTNQLNITVSILRTSSEIIHIPDIPVRICPQSKLLFPMIDSICIVLRMPLILQNQASKTMKVYMTTTVDNIKEFLRFYYNLHKNAIICYLFGLHMFGGNPYPIFGIQPIMMWINIKNASLQFIVLETLFSLSLAYCLFQAIRVFSHYTNLITFDKNQQFYQLVIALIPSALYCIRFILPGFQNDPNYCEWLGFILNLLLFFKNSEFGTIYSILFYLAYDFIWDQMMHPARFFSLQLLLLVGYFLKQYDVPRRQINTLNYVTLLLLNIFMEDHISAFQLVLDLYVIAIALLCSVYLIFAK